MKKKSAKPAGGNRLPRNRSARPPGAPHAAPKPAAPIDLDAALSALDAMNIDALRRSWTAWLGGNPPACQSGDVLRRLLAWHLQAERYGGFSREAKRRLKDLGATGDRETNAAIPPPVALKPGTMITREWRGRLHRVYVLDSGFAHDGRQYGSLSQVARAIAGTRWSGPRFFGIEVKKRQAALDSVDDVATP